MASSCPRCGIGVEQTAAFCPGCGSPLLPTPPAAPAPTVPMPTVGQPPQMPPPQGQYPPTQYVPQQGAPAPGEYAPPAGNRTVVIVMAVIAVVAVIGAVAVLLTRGGDDATGPIVGTSTSMVDGSTTSTATTVATSTTVVDTTSSTTTSTIPATSTTFPTAVPSGQCTAAAVTRDTGLVPLWTPSCDGPWLITDTSCDSTIECEGVDVMRWVDGKWQYRGYFYALCPTRVTDSGMPPVIAKRWFGTDDFCAWERRIVAEPAAGPLEIGDKGERVKAMQTALISLGVLNDVADGEFGPTTRAAVIDFQFLKALTADGIAGATTHAALGLPYS